MAMGYNFSTDGGGGGEEVQEEFHLGIFVVVFQGPEVVHEEIVSKSFGDE